MKKLFLILGIAGFIACNSLIGGSDETTSGGYQVIGAGYDGSTVYICIKNIGDSDITLKSCTINIYKDESTTITTNIMVGTIKAGRCTFVRAINYNSNYDFSYSIKEK